MAAKNKPLRSAEFNQAYDKLVAEPYDVVGLMAYAIYKQRKPDWIISFKKKHRQRPSESDVQKFLIHQLLPAQLEDYRAGAQEVLNRYSSAVLAEATPAIREAAITKELTAALGFWRTVWAGCITAGLYTLILIAIAFILKYSGDGFSSIYNSVTSGFP